MLRVLDIPARVFTVDLLAPPPIADKDITVLTGDAVNLEAVLPRALLHSLPHPILAIEDAAHTYDCSLAGLEHFDPCLTKGDYIVVEDGSIGSILGNPESSAPNNAVQEFLRRRGADYDIDRAQCDRFG